MKVNCSLVSKLYKLIGVNIYPTAKYFPFDELENDLIIPWSNSAYIEWSFKLYSWTFLTHLTAIRLLIDIKVMSTIPLVDYTK